jgi:hypothetical protein
MAPDRQDLTRRQALKALTAATGGVALGLIPKAWETPVVSVGALPTHAQVSPTPGPTCQGDMCALATTTTMIEGQYGDFDFSMCTPSGLYIWGGSSGDGATSSPDNISFAPHVDSETLDIGTAVPGTYSIYLEQWADQPLEITVQIITATGLHSSSLTLTETRAVADVTFPGGQVTWRSHSGWPLCAAGDRLDFIKEK